MLSVDQINQLAPDPASLKAGREQAKLSKWRDTGMQADVLWGLIQGSGKDPYQTVIDLRGPAYNCSCPSRKFPCKHSLGLLLVAAESGLTAAEPPAWVLEWTSKRAASAEKKSAPAPDAAKALAPEQSAEKEQAAARRAESRDKLIADGLAQTRVWLEDLIGQGLPRAQAQPARFWLDQVARLTNAQLTGVARMVEECQATAHSGDGWEVRLLGELSRLHLLCRAASRLDQLDAMQASDLRATLGQPVSREALLAQEGMRGTWQVLVRIHEVHDKLRSYRHWLWCRQTGRITQLIEFAAGAQPLDTSLPPGTVFEGELVFYPGIASRRALIKQRTPSTQPMQQPSVNKEDDLQSAVGRATRLWALQPWVRQIPLMFKAIPRPDLGGFVDEAGSFLGWTGGFQNSWLLAALSGGQPLQVFGELTTLGFLPLSATAPDSEHIWMQQYER